MPSTDKYAFVIMPIGNDGTPEHAYFKALYEDYVKPVLTATGFDVSRADETALSGGITKDIINNIGRADVVIADLTNLNPNVFYEIGVRHALRRSGTVLIIDEERTPTIPFDLAAYRAIMFRGDLAGASDLQSRLRLALSALTEAPGEHSDNPVHDSLPMLPTSAITASAGTEVGELREELAEAKRRLASFERRLGESPGVEPGTVSPRTTITRALKDARDGNLAPDLVRDAEASASVNNREGFLAIVHKIIDREMILDPESFTRLAARASSLGLKDVSIAIYDQALTVHPGSMELRTRRLMGLTHSIAATDRQLARTELMNLVGIGLNGEVVSLPDTLDDEAQSQVAVMLDAFHEDGLDREALAITTALVGQFGDKSAMVRNHARALERTGADDQDALDCYVAAVKCTDVEDLSAVFLGSALHNRHRNVDSLEAYALSAVLDPNDGERFAYIASETAYALQSQLTHSDKSARPLPAEISTETVEIAIVAACSCELFAERALERCVKAAQTAELPGEFISHAVALRNPELDSAPMSRMQFGERYAMASSVYQRLRSELTSTVSRDTPKRTSGNDPGAPTDTQS